MVSCFSFNVSPSPSRKTPYKTGGASATLFAEVYEQNDEWHVRKLIFSSMEDLGRWNTLVNNLCDFDRQSFTISDGKITKATFALDGSLYYFGQCVPQADGLNVILEPLKKYESAEYTGKYRFFHYPEKAKSTNPKAEESVAVAVYSPASGIVQANNRFPPGMSKKVTSWLSLKIPN